MNGITTDTPSAITRTRVAALLGLFVLELVLLALGHQFFAEINCYATEAQSACRGLRSLVARALCVFSVALVLHWARPGIAARFRKAAAGQRVPLLWPLLHGFGVVLLLIPMLRAGGAEMAPDFWQHAPFWIAGAVAAASGGLMWIAPPPVWRAAAGPDLPIALLALGGAFLLPDLADLVLPLWWAFPGLTALTFEAVAEILRLAGQAVEVNPPAYIIGVGSFFVHIADQCSGIEGFALLTGFTLLYALLFHDQIRPVRYALVVLPLGLALSWSLNILRIAALIMIGDRVSPELAVNGFHSYAGWLFFTLLALGLMAFTHATPWLHRAGKPQAAEGPNLRQDWLAARILPFIAFMLLSTLTAAIFPHPELGYPLKAAGMALVLVFFLPALRDREWGTTALPVMVGLGVGVIWVAMAPAPAGDAAALAAQLGAFGSAGMALWILARLIGTILLVPLIEEMFFRGYILSRLDRGGMVWRILALGASSGCFGLLHGRWLEGAAAGLVFGILMLRRGRLADALWAHAAANALVAAVALMRGDWTLI